jgi:alkanesulfonate monooxygenase SsuD/methylene tetrahydromethanopterin reductase-like flavin-dependent oxidoreductase (luciferase family)
MKICIGLPNPVPGVRGRLLVDWARRAEERGFAGLATIDRIAYPNHDSLTSLAAAAGATSHIGLMTNILLAPVYSAPHLAKISASIDQLSGGRFTLGIAPGGRPDDFALTGVPMNRRGRIFDESLQFLRTAWDEGEICPVPVNDRKVPILIGGTSDKAFERVLEYGDGWAAGGAPPASVAPFYDRVRAEWADSGRTGAPRLAALTYFSLGDDAEGASRGYLNHYYAWLGEYAQVIADNALRTPEAIRSAIAAYEEAGCTELYLDPTVAQLDQVDRLADLLL